ncbi:MAG: hypothetical protein IPL23_11275 [Saprospiraceae bacterium]|nr:hypothetical protein [Saprospiraceae bacterium]MBP7643485.1 hypothetical protein [Saprospiraceae bacterium]
MTKIYTHQKNLLVQYIYGECDLFSTLEIEHALEENESLFREYQKLKKIKNQFSKVNVSPSQKSIQKILNYIKRPDVAML